MDKSVEREENGEVKTEAADSRGIKEPRTVILQVEKDRQEEGDVINLGEMAGSMWRKRSFFSCLALILVCLGFAGAAASMAAEAVLGRKGSAVAVVEFHFDGIDKGLDPNGGLFDVTKIKSTKVVSDALQELGWEGRDVEEIRSCIRIEGVIPDTVKQQISVINTVAENAVQYYTAIEDMDYFPSRYTISLRRPRGMGGEETRELLDAILLAYRDYFMDTYANISAIGMATQVLDIEGYDYLQASDIIGSQISMMESYVEGKAEEAPDFRASSTGLSFGDLSGAIRAVHRLDLNNFISFIQSNNLTKDGGVQIDYYNYQIRQYNFEIQELQTQLANVEKTIQGYEKDPVIVMSSQESVAETTQKNEYYDLLLSQKLSLNKKISELNTERNKAYAMVNALNAQEQTATEEDYAYADSLLQGLSDTVSGWGELLQRTTEEYFEAELYADAYRISIPAQYTSMGSVASLVKRMAIWGMAAGCVAAILWGIAGIKEEFAKNKAEKTGQ